MVSPTNCLLTHGTEKANLGTEAITEVARKLGIIHLVTTKILVSWLERWLSG